MKKHQQLNEEVSANYTQVIVSASVLQSGRRFWFLLFRSLVCAQVSESGKALLDVLNRSAVTEHNDTSTKPDFTGTTHGIMGVLHQVMQVQPTWHLTMTFGVWIH